MIRKMMSVVLLAALVISFSPMVHRANATPTYADLAAHWAPTIYQDVNETYGVRADFMTKFNYDGDWRGDNNWENLYNYPILPSVYYSVRETLTHYFIEYDFYYPRDDGPINLERHEHDLEGSIFVIRKDGSTYGSLQLMETQAHNHWYQYSNDSSITNGSENIDGAIPLDGHRAKLYISANGIGSDAGHGVKAYDGRAANGGDGIVFKYQNGTSVMPTDTSGSYTNVYDYALITMDEIWNRRNDTGGAGHTFNTFGFFHGDTYSNSSCTLPWTKDDPDDGPLYKGIYWSDPAFFIDTHLNGLGNFSHTYVYNPYYSHKISLLNVTSKANKDPSNDESDVYLKVSVNGQEHINNKHWKDNQAPLNVTKEIYWGYEQAEFDNQYSEPFNTIYIAEPQNSVVRIEVLDKDGTSSDDTMGYLTANPAPGQSVTWTNTLTSTGEAAVSAVITAY
ncbi:hypothetical protein [Paenibacillus dakarensis]|uniref:hypothetical protein n=1 Tax=Paenibacillus dakarensis TaxID=1527293 RepID=UPI0006D534F7|nr:hypothetical protein [Paenibacillus dakarensis]